MTTNETQCTCSNGRKVTMHYAECPTQSPEQQPDALTRLERIVAKYATHGLMANVFMEQISDARKEMEALQRKHDMLERRMNLTQETCNTLMGRTSETLRMGQQQGRVELAQELLAMTLTERDHHLNSIISEDANQ